MITHSRSAWSKAGLVVPVAWLLGGVPQAWGSTYAPNADPEYARMMNEYIWRTQYASAVRYTSTGADRLISFVRLLDPSDRDHEIWWSYVPDGQALEPSPPTAFGTFGGGQQVEPFMPTDPPFTRFANILFANLNGLLPPYGFRNDGGQRRWQTIISQAFDRWAQVSGIQFIFIGGNPIDDTPNADGGDRWDQNAPWHPTPPAINVGDIRIAMVTLDGPSTISGAAGALLAFTYDPLSLPMGDAFDMTDPMMPIPNWGYAGNIILDEDERWNDPTVPNVLATVISREIGFAIGLNPSCPQNPTIPFSLMQFQPYSQGVGTPLPQLFFQAPQEDDIRAVQFLYGDELESNDTYGEARSIDYAPAPNSTTFAYAPHLALPSNEFTSAVQLSISRGFNESAPPFTNPVRPDLDRFRLALPDTLTNATLTVTIQPVGTPFIDGVYDRLTGTCTGAAIPTDPKSVQDLRIRVDSFDPFTTQIQLLALQNAKPAGQPETISLPVTSGIYYITIAGDGGTTLPTQLYNLTVTVETPLVNLGDAFAPVLGNLGIDAFDSLGVFGAGARFASLDGEHIAAGHQVFSGRSVRKVSWSGVDPAVTTSSAHATTAAGVAAGGQVLSFRGLAPQAQLFSGSIATEVFEDETFSVGKTALYFALFGLADPATSKKIGLPSPVTVIDSTFGGGGRTKNGEDTISQAFDAVAFMTGVTIVTAAGNNGLADLRSFANCPRLNPDTQFPGGRFLGSRSIVPPATAYNVISVGALGTSTGADYDIVANFSSRGPIDSALFTIQGQGATTDDLRAGIDIVAPGTGLTTIPPDFTPANGTQLDGCLYMGPTPTSYLFLPSIDEGDDPNNPANPGAFLPTQGTSVASGVVAGAVALLQDLALKQSPPLSIHPAVMKAILLNGADKLAGWTNNPALNPGKPQDNRDGTDPGTPGLVLATPARPLDVAQGAGALNLERSLENSFTGYPAAVPPQATFDGPTINPPETDPKVPTITQPDEPMGPGAPGTAGRAASQSGEGDEPLQADDPPPSPIEMAMMLKRARGDELGSLFGRSLQFGGKGDPDLKSGRGPTGPAFTTGPQTPFHIPNLGGGGGPGSGPGGTPTGPPGSIKGGVTPREIQPIFVDPIGWDHANIDQRSIRFPGGTTQITGWIDYVINVPLLTTRPDPRDPAFSLPPDVLTITLCWLRTFRLENVSFDNPNDPRIGSIKDLALENLNLLVFAADSAGNPTTGVPIASSISTLGNVEHLSFPVPLNGLYLIRVQWVGQLYDFRASQPLAEIQFGLAWRADFSARPVAGRPFGISDLVSVINSFGGRVGNGRYGLAGDINSDGKNDFNDITAILANWQGAGSTR